MVGTKLAMATENEAYGANHTEHVFEFKNTSRISVEKKLGLDHSF